MPNLLKGLLGGSDVPARAPLDLKKFIWVDEHASYKILAITEFKEDDVVVFQQVKEPYKVEVMSVDEFCRTFQASYELV